VQILRWYHRNANPPKPDLSCPKTNYYLSTDKLRIYKFRAWLWISYFFDDITTFLGPEKTLISWRVPE
jgi:hypothetical protein